jgi:hypothetical protein
MFDWPTCWASVDWKKFLSFWLAVSLGMIRYGVAEAVDVDVEVDDAEVDDVEVDGVEADDDVELTVDVGLVV